MVLVSSDLMQSAMVVSYLTTYKVNWVHSSEALSINTSIMWQHAHFILDFHTTLVWNTISPMWFLQPSKVCGCYLVRIACFIDQIGTTKLVLHQSVYEKASTKTTFENWTSLYIIMLIRRTWLLTFKNTFDL